MRRSLLLVVVAVSLSCDDQLTAPPLRVADAAESDLISLAALAPGDALHVVLHAWGCLHNNLASYVVRREGEVMLRVIGATADSIPGMTLFTETYRDSLIPATVMDRRIDTAITADLLPDLDRWLGYYRSANEDASCTSSTELELTLFRDGKFIRREKYLDTTCGGFDPPELPATSFATLARS